MEQSKQSKQTKQTKQTKQISTIGASQIYDGLELLDDLVGYMVQDPVSRNVEAATAIGALAIAQQLHGIHQELAGIHKDLSDILYLADRWAD